MTIDPRAIRKVELANGILCVLISHANTDRTSVTVTVEVSAYADPYEVTDVVHFLEHMLFIRSTKVSRPFCFVVHIWKTSRR